MNLLSHSQDPIFRTPEFLTDEKTDSSHLQFVFDVEDAGFQLLSGNWDLRYSDYDHAYYYLTIDGPGSGDAGARWIAEGLPRGDYLLETYVDEDDYPTDARYQVICASGVFEETVDLNRQTPGWHPVGNFSINRVCVVNVSDYWEKQGTKMPVDAIRFTLQSEIPDPPSSPVPPRIGVCIDDAGNQNPQDPSLPLYKVINLPFKLTVAVMPQCKYTNESAEAIHEKGCEVILHQPMAAISVPNPGAGGITDSMTLDQVAKVVADNLESLPHVVGMNNHMGSLITMQRDKMQVCIEELKKRNLFFFDSRTFTKSVACELAREKGLLTGQRDLFIDGGNVENSKALIRRMATRALYAPHLPHLAIGHVRQATADALIQIAPELAAMGVEICPVSRCLSQVVETGFTPEGTSVESSGPWTESTGDRLSRELHDNFCLEMDRLEVTTTTSVAFTPCLPLSGEYDIYSTWMPGDDNTTGGLVSVKHAAGRYETVVDQSKSLLEWFYLGRFPCRTGSDSRVTIGAPRGIKLDGRFVADAVKFIRISPFKPRHMWMFY